MTKKTNPATNDSSPSESEIREHAYRLFEQRGHAHGHDVDDWLNAERELVHGKHGAAVSVPSQWRWHFRALTRLRDALLAKRNEHDRAARTMFERVGDEADAASDKNEHDTLLAELSHEDAEFVEVEAALERIRAGTYGICEVTGEAIDPARLRAVPWTRLSRTAAAAAAAVKRTS